MSGTVAQILKHKGSEVVTAEPNISITDAAIKMRENKVGCLVIVDDSQLVGIFHERDMGRRVVADGLSGSDPISSIMNKQFAIINPETPIKQAMAIISSERVRHLPVLDEHKLLGLVSIGDVNQWYLDELNSNMDHLINYITDTYPLKSSD